MTMRMKNKFKMIIKKISIWYIEMYVLVIDFLSKMHKKSITLYQLYLNKGYNKTSIFLNILIDNIIMIPIYLILDKIFLWFNLLLFILNLKYKLLIICFKEILKYLIIILIIINYNWIILILILFNFLNWLLTTKIENNKTLLYLFLLLNDYVTNNLFKLQKSISKRRNIVINSGIFDKKMYYDITLTDLNSNKDFIEDLTNNGKSEMYYNYSEIYDKCDNKDFNPDININNKGIIKFNIYNLEYYYIILEVKKEHILLNNNKYEIIIVYYIAKKNVLMQTYKGELCYDFVVRASIYFDDIHLNKSYINKNVNYKNIDTSNWDKIIIKHIPFEENI